MSALDGPNELLVSPQLRLAGSNAKRRVESQNVRAATSSPDVRRARLHQLFDATNK